MEPNEALEPFYHDISGLRILRQKSSLYGGSETVEGLSFHWNQDGLTFEVQVFCISKEEGIKIVESMIKQL